MDQQLDSLYVVLLAERNQVLDCFRGFERTVIFCLENCQEHVVRARREVLRKLEPLDVDRFSPILVDPPKRIRVAAVPEAFVDGEVRETQVLPIPSVEFEEEIRDIGRAVDDDRFPCSAYQLGPRSTSIRYTSTSVSAQQCELAWLPSKLSRLLLSMGIRIYASRLPSKDPSRVWSSDIQSTDSLKYEAGLSPRCRTRILPKWCSDRDGMRTDD